MPAVAMQHFAVYENPSDYPGRFVVREWHIDQPTNEPAPIDPPLAVVTTLDEARAALPAGVRRIGRMQNDDPVIVEVWL